MVSHKLFSAIILGLSMILLFGLVVIKISAPQCQHPDKKICSMLAKLKHISDESIYGTYSDDTVVTTVDVQWIQEPKQKQIVSFQQDTEVLNAIFTENMIYVKDFSTDKWWEQPKEESETYSYTLIFEPEAFLSELYKRLSESKISYVQEKNTICGNNTCTRYQLSDSQNNEYIELDRKTDKIRSYTLSTDSSTKTIEINYGKKDIMIPTNLQKAGIGVNIFLESAKNAPQPQKGRDLDYVRQFEEQRNAVEKTASSSAIGNDE